ncbi:unnamed protein product [Lathyrus oleraceus]
MQDSLSFVFSSSSTSSSVFSFSTRKKLTRRNREKMVHVKAEDLKNTDNNYKSLLADLALALNPAPVKTCKNPEENFDAPSNSPLPLIKISRVLNGIPQSPHFFQLRDFSELARERLIAAWDQAFEDTAKKVHDLKVKDFWVNARKVWKTMEDLQGMGYNVIPIRRRLVEMTEVMSEFKSSKLKILKMKSKAENHRMEKSRLESVVLGLQMRVEREGVKMVKLLCEVDEIEKALPSYDILVESLAMKSFVVDV